MELIKDLFISHASDDSKGYIQPLVNSLINYEVTFWLDSLEMKWGDNLVLKINEGLRKSRYVLLCLSEAFLARPWPETEMNAALAVQNEHGIKKVLPLILNSKGKVLEAYPLIAGLIYREYRNGPEHIAVELASLVAKQVTADELLHITVESIHTGQMSNLIVSPRVSIKWLVEQVRQEVGLKDSLDTGGFIPFPIRWVLVDAEAELEWKEMHIGEKRKVWAIVKTENGIMISKWGRDRLDNIDVYDNIVFHLQAVDEDDEDDEDGVRYYTSTV